MKKLFILFMILIMSFSLFIAGCGDDDDDGDDNGNPMEPPEQEDFDYFFSLMRFFGRADYMIWLTSYQGETINNATLTINDELITLQYDEYSMSWTGFVTLDVTTVYDFSLTINGSRENWDFTLATPAVPDVDWPMEYDPTQEFALDWVLNPNSDSMIQDLIGTSWDTDYNIIDDVYELLDSDVRSFDVPANWMSSGDYEYDFILAETNYFVTATFLAIAVEVDGATYGMDSRSEIDYMRLREHIRDTIK